MNNIVVSVDDSGGKLIFNDKTYKCAVGKGGILENKAEGDGATPVGCFPIRKIYYRADRIQNIYTVIPTEALKEDDGWCDDSNDENYNKFVKLPYPVSNENLWREDNLYDIIVILGYNDNPAIPGKGSAIFMHVARPTYSPTAGCIALSQEDLLEVLKNVSGETMVCVQK